VTSDTLQRIVARRRERFGVSSASALPRPLTGAFASFSSSSSSSSEANPFRAALRAARGRAVIAEVKMGSPRLGSLAGKFDPLAQAAAYAEAGAACLSVVVEPDFFFGSYELLEACREESGLPAIAKDFVVSEQQLDHAVEAGADAILLVASLYSEEALAAWAGAARARGLVPLVETHDAHDVALLGERPWELVGINNRDLRDFSVDLERSIALRPKLPAGALAVAESGIASRADVARLAAAGFDAFLIGESLLLSGDPRARLRELFP
jgi:indole-3-glycerol phosphate synthase